MFVPIRSSARYCPTCRGNGPAQRRYRAKLVKRRCLCGQPASVVRKDVPHCIDCDEVRRRSLLRARRIKKLSNYAPASIEHLADLEIDDTLLDADPLALSGGNRHRQRKQDKAITKLENYATMLLFASDDEIAGERPVQGVDVLPSEVFADSHRWDSFEILLPAEVGGGNDDE
jgi:hypothetical protein